MRCAVGANTPTHPHTTIEKGFGRYFRTLCYFRFPKRPTPVRRPSGISLAYRVQLAVQLSPPFTTSMVSLEAVIVIPLKPVPTLM